MSNLFIKTFDPFIMNGFKNKKDLENYWLFSQIGTGLICFGLFTILVNELITNTTFSVSLFTMSFIFIAYLIIFSFMLAIPFVVNWLFVKHIPDSLNYHYVRYMWANSKNAILVILSELPPEILKVEDLVKLHQNNDNKAQVKLLIKIWHKNFSKELKHKSGTIN